MTLRKMSALMTLSLTASVTPVLADLRDDVVSVMARSQIGLATIAVCVQDTANGEELLGIRAEELMIPASNLKLFTTGAALHVLGPDFVFRTGMILDGKRLIVVGDGDPAVGDPMLLAEMRMPDGTSINVETFLNVWVHPILEQGIDHLEEVIVDDRVLDRQFVHPSWPIDQLNRRYCAEVSGLNFHLNVLYFYPRSGMANRPDLSLIHPSAPWAAIKNLASTRRQHGDRNTAWIARARNTNRFTLYGNVRFDYTAPVPVTVHDPPSFFAQLLADRLTKAGVSVDAFRSARAEDPMFRGEAIGPLITTRLNTVLQRCNRDSENLYAEALIKRMGHAMTNEAGSWANGTAIVRHAVLARLTNPALSVDCRPVDGSGLSRQNRVTASVVASWLTTFHQDEQLGPPFIASMAVPGETGTLEKRFRNVPLHGCLVNAKSGYISQVSCLSGYVTAAGGRRRAFSILLNDLGEPGSVGKAKRLQEEIVSAIAWDMSETAVSVTD